MPVFFELLKIVNFRLIGLASLDHAFIQKAPFRAPVSIYRFLSRFAGFLNAAIFRLGRTIGYLIRVSNRQEQPCENHTDASVRRWKLGCCRQAPGVLPLALDQLLHFMEFSVLIVSLIENRLDT